MNKTCGECHFYNPKTTRNGCGMCTTGLFKGLYVDPLMKACVWSIGGSKRQITNGERIRQGGNRALAEIFDDLYNGNKCKYCIHHAGSGVCKLNPTPYSEYDEGYLDDEDCLNGFEAWLNAPEDNTESEGKDVQHS